MKLSLFVGCHEWIELKKCHVLKINPFAWYRWCGKPYAINHNITIFNHFQSFLWVLFYEPSPNGIAFWPNGFPRFVSCWGAFREPAHGATAQRVKSQGTTRLGIPPGFEESFFLALHVFFLFHMYYNHVYLEGERVRNHVRINHNKSTLSLDTILHSDFLWTSLLLPNCFSHRISRILLSDLSPPLQCVKCQPSVVYRLLNQHCW